MLRLVLCPKCVNLWKLLKIFMLWKSDNGNLWTCYVLEIGIITVYEHNTNIIAMIICVIHT